MYISAYKEDEGKGRGEVNITQNPIPDGLYTRLGIYLYFLFMSTKPSIVPFAFFNTVAIAI